MYNYIIALLFIICVCGWGSYNNQQKETLGYKKNYELKKMIYNIIDNYERSFQDNTPSCKHEMMDIINPMLDNSIKLFKTWKKKYGNTYIDDSLAHIAIYTAAFDIVTDNKNHIVRGTVDYSGIANHAEKILYKCLDYFVSENIITKEMQKTEISYLENCMKEYFYKNHKTYKDFYLYDEVIYNHFPEKKH